MRSSAIILSLPVAAMAAGVIRKPDVVVRAMYPRQSAGTCTYSCPDVDMNESKLEDSGTAGTDLLCEYDADTCQYDLTNNGAGEAGNASSCPDFADSTGCAERRHVSYKRETNFTAMLRRTAARQEAKAALQEAKRAAREAAAATQEAKRAAEGAERATREAERAELEARRAAREAESVSNS